MRLPPEILCHIFELLRDEYMMVETESSPRGPLDQGEPKLFGWMSILQVCQHWNAVAKSHPALWSYLLCDARPAVTALPVDARQTYLETFLRLSGDAPLKVSFSGTMLRDPGTVARPELVHTITATFTRMHRFRELQLADRVDASFLTLPAPRLTALALYNCTIVAATPTQEMLFGGDLSGLRSLAFDDVQLQIDISRFLPSNYHNLRQLHLGAVHAGLLDGLLSRLSETPLLEDLKLTEVHISTLKRRQRTELLILPRLKHLALGRVVGAHNLLDFLGVPDGVMIALFATPYKDNLILPTDPRRFAGFQKMRKMKLRYPPKGSRFGRLLAISETSALETDVEFRSDQPLGSKMRNMMDTVEEFWIEGHYNSQQLDVADSRQWGRIEIPGLRRLVLDVDVDDVYSLQSCLEAFMPDAGKTCSCPLLELLEIRVRSLTKAIIHQLWELLVTRMRRGSRVKKLRIGRFASTVPTDQTPVPHRKRETRESLENLVDELELVDEETLPRMGTVPVCVTPSTGAWTWQFWDDA